MQLYHLSSVVMQKEWSNIPKKINLEYMSYIFVCKVELQGLQLKYDAIVPHKEVQDLYKTPRRPSGIIIEVNQIG